MATELVAAVAAIVEEEENVERMQLQLIMQHRRQAPLPVPALLSVSLYR